MSEWFTSAQIAWEERGRQAERCIHAIENTAKRLGVDPVAFAEACEDGTDLAIAIERHIETFPDCTLATTIAALTRPSKPKGRSGKRTEPET